MRFSASQLASFLALWLPANNLCEGAAILQPQTVKVPTQTTAWQAWGMFLFSDTDQDGLDDLLVIGPSENRLWIYRQRNSGFQNDPDQAIDLPPRTAWVALGEVEEHPGLELLISTATGVFFLPQNHGVFETTRHRLIEATPVGTEGSPPILSSFGSVSGNTNLIIPVIGESQVVWHQKSRAGVWSPIREQRLSPERTRWHLNRGDWTLGANPSTSLRIGMAFRAESPGSTATPQAAANAAIRKIRQAMSKVFSEGSEGATPVDVNGDGQLDLVLWHLTGDLDPKTDVFVYLQQAGVWPERPTQILHGRGFPIAVGPQQEISPVCDWNRDGVRELVLVALKTALTSWSSLVDMVMTRGLDCVVTIRSFKNGAFLRSPDTTLEVSTMLPGERGLQENFLMEGDFNGDQLGDVLVQRSLTQWDLYFNVAKQRGYAPQPALTLQLPFEGFFFIKDLNRDGRSDVVVVAHNEACLAIYLSSPSPTKGKRP